MSGFDPTPLITGGAGALTVMSAWLGTIMSGKLHTDGYVRLLEETIKEKNEAIGIERNRADSERRRADAAVEAAQTSNLLLAGIRKEITREVEN